MPRRGRDPTDVDLSDLAVTEEESAASSPSYDNMTETATRGARAGRRAGGNSNGGSLAGSITHRPSPTPPSPHRDSSHTSQAPREHLRSPPARQAPSTAHVDGTVSSSSPSKKKKVDTNRLPCWMDDLAMQEKEEVAENSSGDNEFWRASNPSEARRLRAAARKREDGLTA